MCQIRLFCSVLLLIAIQDATSYNSANSSYQVFEIPPIRSDHRSLTNKQISRRYFYRAYQDPEYFELKFDSVVFTKVPNLMLAINHNVSMLYSIRLQTLLSVMTPGAHSMLRFLVDGRVLTSNKLLPNNERRLRDQNLRGTSVCNLDLRGGAGSCSGTSAGSATSFFKSELFILPAGTHTVEVGVRTESPDLHLHAGELYAELTEYDPDLHIGLEYPTAPEYN